MLQLQISQQTKSCDELSTPDQSNKKPDGVVSTPDQSPDKCDDVLSTPDQSTDKPEGVVLTPDQSTDKHDVFSAPDQSTEGVVLPREESPEKCSVERSAQSLIMGHNSDKEQKLIVISKKKYAKTPGITYHPLTIQKMMVRY